MVRSMWEASTMPPAEASPTRAGTRTLLVRDPLLVLGPGDHQALQQDAGVPGELTLARSAQRIPQQAQCADARGAAGLHEPAGATLDVTPVDLAVVEPVGRGRGSVLGGRPAPQARTAVPPQVGRQHDRRRVLPVTAGQLGDQTGGVRGHAPLRLARATRVSRCSTS